MPLSYYSEFITGTIYNWEHLLKDDVCKQIVIGSFHWLTKNKKCTANAFVVMPNHFHMLWKISDGLERKEVQGAFFNFTAHKSEEYLKQKKSLPWEKHFVDKSDRSFQFWEREPMVKACWTKKAFQVKACLTVGRLNYIHFNPCQPHCNLARTPEIKLKEYSCEDNYLCY